MTVPLSLMAGGCGDQPARSVVAVGRRVLVSGGVLGGGGWRRTVPDRLSDAVYGAASLASEGNPQCGGFGLSAGTDR